MGRCRSVDGGHIRPEVRVEAAARVCDTVSVTDRRQPRVRAPELVGKGGWINTGGESYSIADFRGRLCLLDFWTFCCINCLHVIEELRALEDKFSDVMVVV